MLVYKDFTYKIENVTLECQEFDHAIKFILSREAESFITYGNLQFPVSLYNELIMTFPNTYPKYMYLDFNYSPMVPKREKIWFKVV